MKIVVFVSPHDLMNKSLSAVILNKDWKLFPINNRHYYSISCDNVRNIVAFIIYITYFIQVNINTIFDIFTFHINYYTRVSLWFYLTKLKI